VRFGVACAHPPTLVCVGVVCACSLVSVQGIQNLSQAEAQRVSGIDPDFSSQHTWTQTATEEVRDVCP